ncbi:hypothetical protein [Fibrella aquatilis]|uniref:Uncharacterized protein n=1 Tax=Fibrella aquatilis TaxID=2817059 RepID=A0A939G842_9BACT|nr:hypothetical protein [Fibrella aquatilis]MBO0933616.1 hypothetical protein [Fibrella aquatilis]
MSTKWIGPVAISSLALLLFFAFKAFSFQALYYTYNDLYIFLQNSCSWMDGRPLLYENVWGYDDRIHNNYAMLLWGPLIYTFGAYGAFAAQTGLALLSYVLLLRSMGRTLARSDSWLVLSVLLLGPVWIWFNDHPGIGWHPELTYFPLSILFLLALQAQRIGWIILAGAMLVLVKEDGALLAGSIHLAFLSLNYLIANPKRAVFGILAQQRFWYTLGGWAGLFVIGMLFLSWKNHAAEPEPRLQQALTALSMSLHEAAFIKTHLLLLVKTVLLLLPSVCLLLYGLGRVAWQQTGSVMLIYCLAQLPLLVSNTVQSATYWGTNPYYDSVSLTWPPRFVLLYAFSVVYVLAVWFAFKQTETQPVPRWQPLVVGLLLVLLQLPIVAYARPDSLQLSGLRKRLTNRFDPEKASLLPRPELAVIQQLANQIPGRSSVFVFDFLIPIFHKHYNIWPTEKQWENADLAIIPNNDFQHLSERLPRIMKPHYKAVRLGTYTIYVTPAYQPYLTAILGNKLGGARVVASTK